MSAVPGTIRVTDVRAICESTAPDDVTVTLTLGALRAAFAEPPGLRMFTDEQVTAAIVTARGRVSEAARILGPGVTVHAMRWRIERHPQVWPVGVEVRSERGRPRKVRP